MAKHYIELPHGKKERLSWERLAQISECSVEEYKDKYNKHFGRYSFDCRPFAEGIECPFGERDLMHDTCYLGNAEHRCKYFVKYNWEKPYYGYIVCSHPSKLLSVIKLGQPKQPKQLSLFDF